MLERGSDGLLLAESFARLDAATPRAIADWMTEHGVLDSGRTITDLSRPRDRVRPSPCFEDPVPVVLEERDTVAWHVRSLARLSDHLVPDEAGRTGSWDERWAEPAIRVGRDVLWLGGRDRFERHLGVDMQDQPDKPEGAAIPDMSEEDHRTWWRTAHAAWARILADGVPMILVALDRERHFPTWEARAALDDPVDHALSDGRPAGPWGLIELQRRLMAPYIAGAGGHRVEARWPDDATGDAIMGRSLQVHEVRTWDSILSPVYVQLLEGLRRVTEGLRGRRTR